MNDKFTTYAAVAFFVIIICGFALGALFMFGRGERTPMQVNPSSLSPRPCTMDARICPDGSAVGRTGPNCEFAPCPSTTATSSSQTAFTFPKPTPITSQYLVQPEDMQPQVNVTPGSFSCSISEGSIKKIINTRTYCISSTVEGAAGTSYSTYMYTTERAKNLISLTFTIGRGTCANYDEPQKSACTREQKAFNVDSYADKLVQSVVLK